ncbi:hypothetical protein [Ulvibacterium marinum]|uniref:Uncharacterized protein n=1 Tax=Ulvibacterium marinum TaxID=2419782 RepID=A0A3B0CBP6_9FLAO|nr:hypothetical protein [Ulvibacterium marinum]RKN83512.1 hypothetical protein D7Z94_06755 [Ulvibacterium marinum]
MEQKKKNIRNSFRKANSIVHTLKNLYDKAADVDFREFEIMEYGDTERENLTDLKRLNYLKKLQLARNGYIGADLKKQLAQQKEKRRLLDRNARIMPIGSLKIMDGEVLRAQIQIGYERDQTTFSLAYTNHENIPKWRNLDLSELVQFTSRIQPEQTDNLRLEHSHCGNELTHLQKIADIKQVYETYNQCVTQVFHGNKYFTKSILDPNEALLENPELYIGKQFRLTFQEKPVLIATLSEANGHYLSFQSFLKTAPKSETHYFTMGEFKQLFLDSQIEIIAHLKHDLRLGVKDGILHIGRNLTDPPKTSIHWDRYDDIIKTSELPMKVKYYLCKQVIMNKNFVIEKGAVYLESHGKKAFLKKHYRTGKWHFAEIRKPSEELHFMPITPEVSKYIRQQYSQSKDFGTIESRVIDNTPRRTINQIRQ